MNYLELFSQEQLDYLAEMMNIGAGNAATALSQLLQTNVDIEIPKVHVVAAPAVPSLFDDLCLSVACVRMRAFGDITGNLFFVVPEKQMKTLARLAEQTAGIGNGEHSKEPNAKRKTLHFPVLNPQLPVDLSALAEIGNILVGVYLTAIHDFCKLNIYHSVPTIAYGQIKSVLSEYLLGLILEIQTFMLIENKFIVEKHQIRTNLLIVPAVESIKVLVDSVNQASMAYG